MREMYQSIPVLRCQETNNSILNQTTIKTLGSISYPLLPPAKYLLGLLINLIAP